MNKAKNYNLKIIIVTIPVIDEKIVFVLFLIKNKERIYLPNTNENINLKFMERWRQSGTLLFCSPSIGKSNPAIHTIPAINAT